MNVVLAFKAEVVMGFLLVSRHRAPRTAAVLGVLYTLAAGITSQTPVVLHIAWLSISGGVSAVACSRLLARGGALEAIRHAVVDTRFVVVGRFMGAMILVVPLVLGIGLVLGSGDARSGVTTPICYAAGVGALAMCPTAWIGASWSALGALCVVIVGAVVFWTGASGWEAQPLQLLARLPVSMAGGYSPALVGLWLVACLWLAGYATARAANGGHRC